MNTTFNPNQQMGVAPQANNYGIQLAKALMAGQNKYQGQEALRAQSILDGNDVGSRSLGNQVGGYLNSIFGAR